LPIPELDPDTGLLPPGDHKASLDEIESRFGFESLRRRQIFQGLRLVIRHLSELGVREFYVNGSFTTSKDRPKDVDVIYRVPEGSDPTSWGKYAPGNRKPLRKETRVDLLPNTARGTAFGPPIKDYFSTDDDDQPKGLVLLALEDPQDDPQ
jgi:hypothetical protein